MATTTPHRYKQLSLAQLRAFCECVRHKSFSAAARALDMSQPSLWHQVRALERNYQVSLLQRRGRELEPTEDGWVLLDLASSVVGAANSLQESFEKSRHDVPRSLVIIGTPGVITEELSWPLVEFCRHHPQVKITLLSYAIRWTLDSLIAGEADMAILPINRVRLPNPQITSELLYDRPPALLVPRKHPLAAKRHIKTAELARYPLILPETDNSWRQRVDEVFRASGVLDKLRVVVEVGVTQATRHYVELGLGIALMPLPGGRIDSPRVHTHILDRPFPTEEVHIFWRRGVQPRPQARLFANFVREALARKRPVRRRS